MRIAVVHDYFDLFGGGEREILQVAEGLSRWHDVEIVTGFYNHNNSFSTKIPIIEIKPKIRKEPFFQSELAWRFSRFDFSKYDAVVSENYWSVFARHKNHMHHCETPIRPFYARRGFTSLSMHFWQRPFFNTWVDAMMPFEQKAMKSCKVIFTNSENIKDQIKLYYGRDDAVVVYPPVELDKHYYKKTGDYFLYVGRMEAMKRVGLIVEAFKKTDKKVVIIGGGPGLDKIKRMAEGYDNIKITGFVSDKDLYEYYANSMCQIHLAWWEDFGAVITQSHASGKPCLTVADGGGSMEIVEEGKTGWFVRPRVDGVVEKVNYITSDICRKMKKACLENAKRFDYEIYIKKVRELVEGMVSI